MDLQTIEEMLTRQPFAPFKVRLSDGTAYDVHNPDLVVPLRTKILLAFPADDRFAVCSLLHITAVETLRNGHRIPRRRRPH